MVIRNVQPAVMRAFVATGLLAVGTFSVSAQSYTFNTFAGAAGAAGTADGTGGSSRFRSPGAVTADRAGNIYIADTGNHTIRKITPAGVVTTLAGSAGNAGSADGTGSAARFRYPYGIAADNDGTIFVADTYNHTIRKVTAAGAVTTLAGSAGSTGSANGTGSAARFNVPCGIAVDAAGNIIVADAYNHTIRKVTAAGVATTLAGAAGAIGSADGAGGNAQFWTPRGVALDPWGNILVADMSNQTLRRISPAGIVTTLAGFTEPLSKWVKHGYAEENVFREACLRSLQRRGAKTIFYVLQNSSEGFNLWLGGNVVLGMYMLGTPSPVDGHRTDDWVKRCNSAGVTTQVPVLFNCNDSFAAQTSQHDSYIQWVAQSIVWAPSDQFIVCVSHHTHLNQGVTSAWTPDYVNQLAGKVKQYAGSRFKVAIHDHYPECLTWGRGSNIDLIYVDRQNRTDAEMATVLADVRAQTGKAAEARITHSENGTGGGAQFETPAGIATDGAGNAYVADSGDYTIRRVTPAGVATTLAGNPGFAGNVDGAGNAARFYGLGGIAVDRGDNVFATDGSYHTLRKGYFEVRLAVNAPTLPFTTGGDINWVGQTVISHDGMDAARSGPIGDGQQSWMQTTVTGPGSLFYWWKVSSEAGGDLLSFLVDGTTQEQISGNADWKLRVRFLGAGTHTLQWLYAKNSSGAAGTDAAWVDQVQWQPCAAASNVTQVFFQDGGGLLASWVLNSTGGFQFARFLANTEGWKLKTAGDVDRNGTADLLFQTAGGDLALWFMNADGTTRATALLGNTSAWEPRACTEYDGDGHTEIFFQTPTGVVAFWRVATDSTFLEAQVLGNMGAWRLKTATDMDGDGMGDLLWQTPNGTTAVWFHNTDGSIRGQILGMTNEWELRGATDVDGDGVGDLLWQTPDSRTGGWFMRPNGTARDARFWWPTGGWQLKAAGR